MTAIDVTPVKEQIIGTCWVYATAAWAESLHLEATGRSVDLSASYWTYWAFYDRIVNGEVDENGLISETGTWGDAAEIIARYGVMRETDFLVPEPVHPTRRTR